MPGPNPYELWIDDDDPERPVVWFEQYFWTGNRGNRMARAVKITRRLRLGDWQCRWCGDMFPDYKRADARYCCERCRKAAAQARRKATRGQRSV
jgi:hypothetical protein